MEIEENQTQKRKRRRQEICELTTGKRFLNESEAAEEMGCSRYLVHKSITRRVPVSGLAFAPYYYGIDMELVKKVWYERPELNRDSAVNV